jgi:alpha-ketoglutarate-dependent taurine dioxygenase
MHRDPAYKKFEVLPITGALGAEIRGVNLQTADEATFEDVRSVLNNYHVLAVRDQNLDPQKLQKVARRFGPFSDNPVHASMEGAENIIRFVREPDDTGVVIGENWHMDLAWLPKPPGITLLYGEVVPPVGGDTCFSSLEHAYKMLSPKLKSMLTGLIGIYSGKGVYAINAKSTRLALRKEEDRVEEIETEHPLICKHPVTGRPYVMVNSVLNRFKGMTEAESKPVIDYLMSCAVRPEFNCRLRWEEGTLGMWANPYVLHTAINDYPGYRRIMYRTTIEGWPLQAAEPSAIEANKAA